MIMNILFKKNNNKIPIVGVLIAFEIPTITPSTTVSPLFDKYNNLTLFLNTSDVNMASQLSVHSDEAFQEHFAQGKNKT